MNSDALSVIACGSAAAAHLPEYLMELKAHCPQPLRLLLTSSASRFVQPQAMRWYSDELYESGAPDLNPVEFALQSACVVVLPATANMLAASALGLAATPAQTILLSAPPPVVFFPAMNLTMWQAPQIRRHLATLRGDGHTVVDPHEREVYQYWRRGIAIGLAPPPADHVRKVITARLASACG